MTAGRHMDGAAATGLPGDIWTVRLRQDCRETFGQCGCDGTVGKCKTIHGRRPFSRDGKRRSAML